MVETKASARKLQRDNKDLNPNKTYQAFQTLGHDGGESVFTGEIGNEENVLWSRDLVGSVSSAELLDGAIG